MKALVNSSIAVNLYLPPTESSPLQRWRWIWLFVGLAGFVVLCGYVMTRTKPPIYDEVPYFVQVDALGSSDSFRTWLVNNDTGPIGPVHALMHYALSGGHGVLPAPWFRLVNLILLASVLALIALQLRCARISAAWESALVGMAVPMVWVMAGMALTELPAMIGVAVAYYAASKLDTEPNTTVLVRVILTMAIALGVMVAVCGRQTYLLVVPMIPLLAARDRRSLVYAVAGAILGMIPALWLFMTWGGVVPPKMASVGGGLKLAHGLQAVSYVGVIVLLIAPSFFRCHWRKSLLVSGGVFFLNLMVPMVHFAPMATVHKALGDGLLVRVALWGAGQIFLLSGAFFLVTVLSEVWQGRDRRFAAYAFAVLALCGACVAITHQFSSRYVGMSLPLLIPMLAPWYCFTPWGIMRWLLGMGIGAVTLHSYYMVH